MWCSRWDSAATEYENVFPRCERGMKFQPTETIHQRRKLRSSSLCRTPIDTHLPQALCRPAIIRCIFHLHLFASKREKASCLKIPAVPSLPAHRQRVCPWRCRERAWKSGSSCEPFFQANVHDLPLLLGRLLKFGGFIIVQPAAQNLQKFAGGFSRCANDEDTAELLLVLTIAPLQSHLHGFLSRCRFLLFLFRPSGRLRIASFFRAGLTDCGITPNAF